MLQLTRWRWLPNKLLGTLRMREILLCCFKLGFWISGTITRGKIALNRQWVLKTLMPYLKLPISNRQAVFERNNQLAKKDVLSQLSRAMIEQCSSRKLFLESCRSLKRLAVELRRVACSSSSQADVMLNSDRFSCHVFYQGIVLIVACCWHFMTWHHLKITSCNPTSLSLASWIESCQSLPLESHHSIEVRRLIASSCSSFNGRNTKQIDIAVKYHEMMKICLSNQKTFHKISDLLPSLDPF